MVFWLKNQYHHCIQTGGQIGNLEIIGSLRVGRWAKGGGQWVKRGWAVGKRKGRQVDKSARGVVKWERG